MLELHTSTTLTESPNDIVVVHPGVTLLLTVPVACDILLLPGSRLLNRTELTGVVDIHNARFENSGFVHGAFNGDGDTQRQPFYVADSANAYISCDNLPNYDKRLSRLSHLFHKYYC